MLDELVGQVKRLFSSKKNAARLVLNQTDRIHHYKLILVAFCIALLVGYTQFRPHFKCQGIENVSDKDLTNFCWINGTITINIRDDKQQIGPRNVSSPPSVKQSSSRSQYVSVLALNRC